MAPKPRTIRRSGKRCVKPRKGLKRRCTRYKVVSTLTRGGDLVVKGRAGARSGIDQKGGTILVLDAGRTARNASQLIE